MRQVLTPLCPPTFFGVFRRSVGHVPPPVANPVVNRRARLTGSGRPELTSEKRAPPCLPDRHARVRPILRAGDRGGAGGRGAATAATRRRRFRRRQMCGAASGARPDVHGTIGGGPRSNRQTLSRRGPGGLPQGDRCVGKLESELGCKIGAGNRTLAPSASMNSQLSSAASAASVRRRARISTIPARAMVITNAFRMAWPRWLGSL